MDDYEVVEPEFPIFRSIEEKINYLEDEKNLIREAIFDRIMSETHQDSLKEGVIRYREVDSEIWELIRLERVFEES